MSARVRLHRHVDRPTPRHDRVILGLLVIAAVFLLSHLDNGYLWQDEAETALLARNTLRFGYPRAFDGRNHIQEPYFGYGPGEAWIYSPWLVFYLLAGLFAVAGQSTWIARLPFALFGLVSIYLTWRLVVRLTPNLTVQRLSVALLTLSVPFLLHMRQCRYYALATALVVGTCLAYVHVLNQPSTKRATAVGLLLVLLFHTNFGTFLPTAGALLIHVAIWGDRVTRRRLWTMLGVVFVLTIPWAVFFYQPTFVGTLSLDRLSDHLEYYVRMTNKYLVPLAFLAGVSLWWVVVRQRRLPLDHLQRALASPTIACLMVMVIAHVSFLLIPNQRHMRYLIPILPLLLIGEAWWLATWHARSRLIGGAFMGLILLTNVVQSTHVRIPLAEFLYELTHRYTGPMEGVVSYLRQHGQPHEVVKIPYDDRTVMFYTDMEVEEPSRFLEDSDPTWVVIRREWVPAGFFESAYFRQIETAYERIELDAPDILWQNREDPGAHHFRTVRDAPRIVIYRKRAREHGES